MATTQTQLPVPSESPIDLKYNAGKVDEFVTSLVNTYVDRFGKEHYTIEGLRWLAQQSISQFGYITLDSFEDGNTLTLPNQVLRLEATGEYYRWDGSLPKDVPSGSTPETTGGIGIGAWLSVGDSALRSELASDVGDPLVSHHKVQVAPQGTLAEMEYYFTPEQFDAVGDGVANDTIAVNNCMTAAKNAGCSVRGKIGSTYGVGVVVHPLGLKRVYDLQLKCIIPGTDAVYRSEFVNGHTDVTINGVSVNINSNASKGIMIHGFADSLITKCRVFGFSGLIDSYGIRIGTPDLTLVSRNNKITDNYVLMPTDPAAGTGTYGLNGIALMGNASSPYGGFEVAGLAIWPSVITILDTEISGNYIYGGTHNITGAGIFRANIHHNNLQSPSHRNVNLSGNCQRTKVLHNFLLEAGSSGVNMAWGNRWNLIQGNFIQSNSSAAQTTDDAALQVHKGGEN
ncbi:hypothetical protein K7H59_000895, partial [Escherichia coli]|nr:hypothetical protein [Escherichia coli]